MCLIEVYVIRSQSSVPNSQTSEVARTHSMRRSLKLSSSASKWFRLSRLRWNKAKHFEHSDEILENESKKSLEVFVGNVEICPHWTSSFEEHGPSTFLSRYLLTLNKQSRPVCTSSSVVVSSREHTWEFPKWLTIRAHLGCLTDWLTKPLKNRKQESSTSKVDTLEEVSEPCSSWSSFCTSNTSGLTKDASAKEIGILRIRGNLATQDDGMDAKVKVKICLQAKWSLLLVSRAGEIWSIENSCFVGNTKVPLVKKAIHRQHSSGNHSQQNSGTTNQPTNQTPNRPTSQTTPNYQAPQIFGWQGADYALVVLSVLVAPVLVVLEVVGSSWALAGDICLSMSGLPQKKAGCWTPKWNILETTTKKNGGSCPSTTIELQIGTWTALFMRIWLNLRVQNKQQKWTFSITGH